MELKIFRVGILQNLVRYWFRRKLVKELEQKIPILKTCSSTTTCCGSVFFPSVLVFVRIFLVPVSKLRRKKEKNTHIIGRDLRKVIANSEYVFCLQSKDLGYSRIHFRVADSRIKVQHSSSKLDDRRFSIRHITKFSYERI